MIRYTHTRPGLALLPEGVDIAQEVVSRRSSHGKTFDLGGNQYRVRAGIAPVHFHDPHGKQWEDIDLTVTERGGELICDTAGYTVRLGKDIPRAMIESAVGDGDVELDKIPGGKVTANSVHLDGNEVVWTFDNDLSVHAELRPRAVEFYKLLGSDKSPRRFEWRINKATKQIKLKGQSAGKDNGKRNLQMVSELDGARYVEEWTGKVGKIQDAKTRRKSWVDEADYPILVDTRVEVGVVADADDVTDLGTAISTGAFKASLTGTISATQKIHAGVRFQALNIPAGATITAALIRVTCTTGVGSGAYSGKGGKVKVYGDKAAADAPAWAALSQPSGATKTAGKFTMPATIIESDIIDVFMTDAVQEIVDLAAWTANNDMRFVFWQNGTFYSFGKWIFTDYPTLGTLFDVWYTTATPISMPRVRIGH